MAGDSQSGHKRPHTLANEKPQLDSSLATLSLLAQPRCVPGSRAEARAAGAALGMAGEECEDAEGMARAEGEDTERAIWTCYHWKGRRQC